MSQQHTQGFTLQVATLDLQHTVQVTLQVATRVTRSDGMCSALCGVLALLHHLTARASAHLLPVVAMLQLLERLPAALAAALPTQPCLLYLSPAAADALATANSCCEYLEQRRQLGVLAFGTPPFPDAELTKSRQLLILAPANDSTSSSSGSSGGGGGSSQHPVWGTEARGDVAGGMAVDGGGLGSDRWGPALQQAQVVGPCVVFVPVWSLAAGEDGAEAGACILSLMRMRSSGDETSAWG